MAKFRLAVAALVLAGALAVSGCGAVAPAQSAGSSPSAFASQPGGTLRVSGFNPSDEVGKSRSDYASAQLSEVKIELDTTAFDPQKFAAQSAAGQVPDLVLVDRYLVATFAARGLIVPLDACFAQWGVDADTQYYPATLTDVTYRDARYGIPQFFQASALLGNKRVMDQAGVKASDLDTAKPDQVIAAAKKMYRAGDGNPALLGFDPDAPGSTGLWFLAFGGGLYNDDGSPKLDDPANLAALDWLKQLMDAQGGYPKVKSFKDTMDVFGNENQYVKDQVGVQTWAQWYPNVLAASADEVSLEAIPIRDRDGQPIAVAGGTAFVIPKAAGNPSAACAWAVKATSTDAWLAAGEARAQTVKKNKSIATGLTTGSPVADQAIRERYVNPSGDADFDQVIDTYYSILASSRSLGSSPVGQQVKQELDNAVVVALSGEKSTAQALADAQAAAMRAWSQVK